MAFRGSIVAELRRRRVFRASAFYIVGAWVALQVVGEALPALNVPDEAIRFVWLIAIFGFPIAVLLSWRYEFGDGALVRTPPAAAGDDIDLSLKTSDYLILIAMLIVSTLAVWQAVQRISQVEEPQAVNLEKLDAPENSIVVLPLRTLGQSGDSDYFIDGLTEELSFSLARFPQLRVTASRSAYTVAQLGLDVREIGRRLGVRYILDGSVQRAGERVRVNIELLEADSGSRVWQAGFDEEFADLRMLQTDIARSVMTALKTPLDSVDAPNSGRNMTQSPVAQDFYWLGTNEIRQMESKGSFGDWVDRAIAYLEQAIEADPEFAEAHARLARTYLYFLWSVRGDKFISSTETAQRHIDRALELDPESETAYLAASRIRYAAYDFQGYTEMLERVLEINPANFTALSALGQHYWSLGRIVESQQLLRSAYLLDPLNPDAIELNAQIDARLGDYDAARNQLVGLMDDHQGAVGQLIQLDGSFGRFDSAARWASLLHQQDPDDALSKSYMAGVATVLGAYDIAEQWLQNIDPSARSLTITTEFVFLLSSGRFEQAQGIADMIATRFIPETVETLSPQQAQMLSRVAFIFAITGDYERAIHEWNRIDPEFRKTYLVYEQLNFQLAMMVATRAVGDEEQGEQISESLNEILTAIESAGESSYPAYTLSRAEWHAANGSFDAALVTLSLAVDQGYRDAARIRVMPVWEELRENQALLEILRRIETDVAEMRQHALDEGWLRGPE